MLPKWYRLFGGSERLLAKELGISKSSARRQSEKWTTEKEGLVQWTTLEVLLVHVFSQINQRLTELERTKSAELLPSFDPTLSYKRVVDTRGRLVAAAIRIGGETDASASPEEIAALVIRLLDRGVSIANPEAYLRKCIAGGKGCGGSHTSESPENTRASGEQEGACEAIPAAGDTSTAESNQNGLESPSPAKYELEPWSLE